MGLASYDVIWHHVASVWQGLSQAGRTNLLFERVFLSEKNLIQAKITGKGIIVTLLISCANRRTLNRLWEIRSRETLQTGTYKSILNTILINSCLFASKLISG